MACARDYYRGFGRKPPLSRVRGNAIEVELRDLLPDNKILDVFGRDGTLHSQLTDTKSQAHYFADPLTLVCFPRIRNGISRKNKSRGRIRKLD